MSTSSHAKSISDTKAFTALVAAIDRNVSPDRAAELLADFRNAVRTETFASAEIDSTVYRVVQDAETLGTYTTAVEARKHCESVAREEYGGEHSLFWCEGEDTVDQPEQGPAWLVQSPRPGVKLPTGLAISPIAVKSAFEAGAR
ncbi:hypothetical protein ACFYO9_37705 [Streptomyces sp. NPDC005863]|uniref:hypothetical protein n=1 Tax=Streptomyces sp. NPDC005863 TaxID=3364735 RepID=UPI0036CC1875